MRRTPRWPHAHPTPRWAPLPHTERMPFSASRRDNISSSGCARGRTPFVASQARNGCPGSVSQIASLTERVPCGCGLMAEVAVSLQIAFLGGEEPEKAVLNNTFTLVISHLNRSTQMNFNSEVQCPGCAAPGVRRVVPPTLPRVLLLARLAVYHCRHASAPPTASRVAPCLGAGDVALGHSH